MRLDRVVSELPPGFDRLMTEASAEGYRHVARLAAEWAAGTTRFEREGEALIAVHLGGELVAIGGLTVDPAEAGALRMRRFYVRRSFRRKGIGRKLAQSLLAGAGALGRPVTVNAGAGSEPFWLSLGFVADRRSGHTHVLRRPPGVRDCRDVWKGKERR